LDPRLFSFNSRQGACPDCAGSGVRIEPDPDAFLAPGRALDDGGLLPFDGPERRGERRRLLQALRQAEVPLDRPAERLGARQRRTLLALTSEALASALADDPAGLDAFTAEQPCESCHGTRLNARARAVR